MRATDMTPVHDTFSNIGSYLREGDVLVVNNTKVMKARLNAFKKTGGRVEILLVRALAQGGWEALINGKGPFLPGVELYLRENDAQHTVRVVGKSEIERGLYELACDIDLGPYAEIHGELPLPPYFGRRADEDDEDRYQTIFAKELGAVAAPTAGLHFTDAHLSALKARGIDVVETTLHVGPGTFLPIRTENINDHQMHTEFFHMTEACAERLNIAKRDKKRIIPVGSTAMRVIEQVMHSAREQNHTSFFACSGKTAMYIKPGYKFLGCDAIITNFHLPRSTLLLLVSALAGRERVLRAYGEAIERRYRFFSYGDACYFEMWNQS